MHADTDTRPQTHLTRRPQSPLEIKRKPPSRIINHNNSTNVFPIEQLMWVLAVFWVGQMHRNRAQSGNGSSELWARGVERQNGARVAIERAWLREVITQWMDPFKDESDCKDFTILWIEYLIAKRNIYGYFYDAQARAMPAAQSFPPRTLPHPSHFKRNKFTDFRARCCQCYGRVVLSLHHISLLLSRCAASRDKIFRLCYDDSPIVTTVLCIFVVWALFVYLYVHNLFCIVYAANRVRIFDIQLQI